MRKILYAILPIALALTLAVGVAFSAWRLEALDKSQTSLTDKRDDIFENYDIKKADETQVNRVNTYTMYLYPSTLYLNDYADYINGVDGAVLPEEKYGYIEPVVARDGAVSYNVVDKNGGDGSYLKDVANNGSYVMSDEKRTLGMLYSVYAKNSVWNKREGNELSDITYNWAGTTVYGDLKFLYGDPVLDKTTVEYTESTTGADLQDGGSGERHGWRNLHYYDRFGYWTTLAKGEGRYLPLKITVDENFSNTYYDSVVMSPFSDMGDPRDWYVYTFSCWAYVAYDATSDSYALPYYATAEFANSNSGTNYVSKASNGSVVANPSLGSFCPTTVSQYFDIIESFEKYTDENGVIRLFPKFSNGKGYAANSIKDGGGDAIKVIPETKGADGGAAELDSLDQHELYMFYSTETGSVTDNGTSVPVNVSVLPNIDIDKYYSLNFMVAPETSLHGWLSWTDIYSLDRQETKDSNKNITDTLQSYGYGLYNLYFFITDVGSSTSSNDCRDGLETLRQNLVKKDTSLQGSFPTLYGKNLLPIASVYVQFVENSQYYGKSFMLVAEKVREAKFIGDVNFGGTNNTTEQELQDKYLSTDKSFRLINQTLYGIENNSDTESAINSQFPYCYILQNVDFTEATTPYCQIRFQRAYRSDLHFATTDEYRYNRIKFSGETYVQGSAKRAILRSKR